mgnify:CR=1 FL=1|jgi:hypothetical protein
MRNANSRLGLLLALSAACTALQLPASPPTVTAAFMKKDFWEPPMEESTAARSSSLHGLDDPCFWTDGCEADGDATPTSMMVELSAEDLMRELPAMPCITTEEECDTEAAAGLAYEPLAPEVTKLDDKLLDPCFWDLDDC